MDIKEKSVILFNPPGRLWIRGEPRCEESLEKQPYMLTAPNNLAVYSVYFRRAGMNCRIIDYPAENKGWDIFERDISEIRPSILIMNATSLSIDQDIAAFEKARKILGEKVINILYLPYLGHIDMKKIDKGYFAYTDIGIIGEGEAVIPDIIRYYQGQSEIGDIRGIVYFISGVPSKTAPADLVGDLDEIPFPDRSLINNSLYTRPDNGQPLASIDNARGCPNRCIFCRSSIMTGTEIRSRSVDSVVREMRECRDIYGIREFLFRADNFTGDREWVIELCARLTSELPGVSWAANSRTDTFDEGVAAAMKRAGCYLVEFGVESCDDGHLIRMKKNTTVDNAEKCLAIAHSCGLMTYGVFLIGFPWDMRNGLKEMGNFVLKEDLDFMEVFIVQAVPGTELFDMLLSEGLVDMMPYGSEAIAPPVIKGTRSLSHAELEKIRRKMHYNFYFRPKFVFRRLRDLKTPAQFLRYAKLGLKLFKMFRATG